MVLWTSRDLLELLAGFQSVCSTGTISGFGLRGERNFHCEMNPLVSTP